MFFFNLLVSLALCVPSPGFNSILNLYYCCVYSKHCSLFTKLSKQGIITTMNSFQLNPNLTLLATPTFGGLAVNQHHGPLINEYLAINLGVIKTAMIQQSRCLFVHITLNYPSEWDREMRSNDTHTTLFTNSLRDKLRRYSKKRNCSRINKLNYIRCTEVGEVEGGLHHHMVLIFNASIFNSVGEHGSMNDNLIYRIISSWASAIGIPEPVAKGLVHFSFTYPVNSYRGSDEDIQYDTVLNNVFYNCSYLAKVKTKDFSLGKRLYSSSQIKWW